MLGLIWTPSITTLSPLGLCLWESLKEGPYRWSPMDLLPFQQSCRRVEATRGILSPRCKHGVTKVTTGERVI
eukprot:590922-Amphidinium_carterae.3